MAARPVFVLHDHRKPRPHFDLRLEEDGVLRSWAVPKGMPTDVRRDRLAVAVDDHDLAHATYTDDDKSIADHGWWDLVDRSDRRFVFDLHGQQGVVRYALIDTGRDWLLHLVKEQPAGTPDGRTALATVVSHDLITTPFGFDSTAAEVIAGVDLSGKRAIVTGGASGIGVETARALADAGAHVTLAVRDTAAGGRVAEQIDGRVDVAPLDLSSPASIAAFVAAWDGPLHILVNNAGVMAIQALTLSPTGHEMQFATNHLGHFALTTGLHRVLAAAGGARVVSVSSSGHLRSPVVFDDVDYAFREYDPFGAYGQSKTANVLFAVEASTRWADDGITANALMPGGILTALQRHLDPNYGKEAEERFRRAGSRLKSPAQGAATSTLLAASPLLDGVGGRYFEDCNEAPIIHRRDETTIAGVAPYALDPENAARLWHLSALLTS